MIETLIGIPVLAGGMGIAAWLLVRLGIEGAVRNIQSAPQYHRALKTIKRDAGLLHRFQERRLQLMADMGKAEAQRRDLANRKRDLEREVATLRQDDGRLVRLVGERTARSKLYRAELVNRHVQRAVREQRRHPFLHPSWVTTQEVEIWAADIEMAQEMVARHYPGSAGFLVGYVAAVKTPAMARREGA
jgi:hypothetical protein